MNKVGFSRIKWPVYLRQTSAGGHSVADCDDGVQAVVLEHAPDGPATFVLNYREIHGSCRFHQFAFGVDVLEVQADVIGDGLEQFGHQAVRQPQRLRVDARRLRGLNGLQRGLITVGGMPQKNHAQHRHGIFGGREVGIGTELIGGFPQAGFNLRDVVEGVGGHLCGG